MGQHLEAIAELDRIEPGSPRARAEVVGARVWLLLYSGQCRRALDVGSADAAASAGLTWPFPLAAAAHANVIAGRTATALSLSERGLGEEGVVHARAWGRAMLGWPHCLALLLSGRTARAQEAADDGYAVAGQFVDGNMTAVWAVCRGKWPAQGRLAAAEGAYREAVTLLGEWDSHHFSRYVLAELAGVFALAGDAPAAREWMRRSDARRTSANLMLEPWAELGRAWVIAAGGGLALAAQQARYAECYQCAPETVLVACMSARSRRLPACLGETCRTTHLSPACPISSHRDSGLNP
jgi:hypothetical protein